MHCQSVLGLKLQKVDNCQPVKQLHRSTVLKKWNLPPVPRFQDHRCYWLMFNKAPLGTPFHRSGWKNDGNGAAWTPGRLAQIRRCGRPSSVGWLSGIAAKVIELLDILSSLCKFQAMTVFVFFLRLWPQPVLHGRWQFSRLKLSFF